MDRRLGWLWVEDDVLLGGDEGVELWCVYMMFSEREVWGFVVGCFGGESHRVL